MTRKEIATLRDNVFAQLVPYITSMPGTDPLGSDFEREAMCLGLCHGVLCKQLDSTAVHVDWEEYQGNCLTLAKALEAVLEQLSHLNGSSRIGAIKTVITETQEKLLGMAVSPMLEKR